MVTGHRGDPEILGWPPDGPTLRLDYRRFSYAGKFVMSNTGKAVIRTAEGAGPADETDGRPVDADATSRRSDAEEGWDDSVIAAAAFNEDRTDGDALWIRYVTVRDDRRGEGLGPELCSFVAGEAADRGYDRVRIAVNNPFAYEALYRAGFAFTGEETGIAELVLQRPADDASMRAAERSTARYREGLEIYAERDLSTEEAAFLERKRGEAPPGPFP